MAKKRSNLTEALLEISQKRLGMTAVLDADQRLLGVFTDGDLRRALGNGPIDFNSTPVSALMAKHPKTVPAGHLAVEAAHLLEQHRINGLLVLDADGRWDYLPQKTQQLGAAAAAAPAKVAAGAAQAKAQA